VGLGALNELIEFTAALIMAQTNVGGYLNTGWDLVANFVGAAAGGDSDREDRSNSLSFRGDRVHGHCGVIHE
jgi:hypothetical protein